METLGCYGPIPPNLIKSKVGDNRFYSQKNGNNKFEY